MASTTAAHARASLHRLVRGGVGLPVLAGALFDRTGSYASKVWVAARINGLGMLVARRLPASGASKFALTAAR